MTNYLLSTTYILWSEMPKTDKKLLLELEAAFVQF